MVSGLLASQELSRRIASAVQLLWPHEQRCTPPTVHSSAQPSDPPRLHCRYQVPLRTSCCDNQDIRRRLVGGRYPSYPAKSLLVDTATSCGSLSAVSAAADAFLLKLLIEEVREGSRTTHSACPLPLLFKFLAPGKTLQPERAFLDCLMSCHSTACTAADNFK